MSDSEKMNPFGQTLYEEFNLDPFASETELMEQAEKVFASFSTLSDEEKGQKFQAFQDAVKVLRDRAQRVQINALLLNRLDVKTVISRLRNIPGEDLKQVAIPDPDLSQVITEGNCPETIEEYFQPVESIPSLEFDLAEVQKSLSSRVAERHFLFET